MLNEYLQKLKDIANKAEDINCQTLFSTYAGLIARIAIPNKRQSVRS